VRAGRDDRGATCQPVGVSTSAPSSIAADDFERMVAATMPIDPRFRWRVVDLQHGLASVRLDYDDAFVRPGGTISGPTLFTLADLTLWAAVLSVVGMQPLAVTTQMSIHFLRRPPPAPLVARCEVLRAGRRLVHGDVRIYTDAAPGAGLEARGGPVCHATGSYAVPEAPAAVRSSGA
jgi:uncharacterized protein (TIGR00369 family)